MTIYPGKLCGAGQKQAMAGDPATITPATITRVTISGALISGGRGDANRAGAAG